MTEHSVDEGEGEEENALIQQTFKVLGGMSKYIEQYKKVEKDSVQRKQGMMDAASGGSHRKNSNDSSGRT